MRAPQGMRAPRTRPTGTACRVAQRRVEYVFVRGASRRGDGHSLGAGSFNWIEPPPPPRSRTPLVTLFGCEIAVYKLEARLPALSNGGRNLPLRGGFNSEALFLRTTWRCPDGQRALESERERERERDRPSGGYCDIRWRTAPYPTMASTQIKPRPCTPPAPPSVPTSRRHRHKAGQTLYKLTLNEAASPVNKSWFLFASHVW
jgi:hypothetical protein